MKIYIVTDCGNGRIDSIEKDISDFTLFIERIKNTLRMKSNFKIFATHENNCFKDLLFKNKLIK